MTLNQQQQPVHRKIESYEKMVWTTTVETENRELLLDAHEKNENENSILSNLPLVRCIYVPLLLFCKNERRKSIIE